MKNPFTALFRTRDKPQDSVSAAPLFYFGTSLCYNHNRKTKKLADGTERLYESDVYRCYRKVSSRQSCQGPSSYAMEPLNEAVEKEVREFFTNLGCVPADQLVANACDRKAEVLQVAYRQAVSDFEKTQKQVSALETEAVKALTGESQLDLSVVNGMLLKLRAQQDKDSAAVEEARAKVEADEKNRKATEAQVEQLLTWAEKYDEASYEAKHLIIAALVDRVEVNKNYEVKVFFKVSAEQFLGRVVRIA